MTRKWYVAAVLLVVLTGALTRGFWTASIAWSLVCREEIASSDAILVENFDPDFRLFERAAALQQAGVSSRVLVPVQAAEEDSGVANPISRGIGELMARFARVQSAEIIPIREVEPYSLTAAYQIGDFLAKRRMRSIVVVAPAFRSRRSFLVYGTVLRPLGIRVYCLPVSGGHTPENWTTTWHGIQAVAEQFGKLQFYRFYVLRTTRGSG